MKKYFLLVLMAMGGAVPAMAFGATLSVSPANGTYQTGNIITAQIIVDTQGVAIEGADIRYLNYNPTLLEVQDENTSLAGVQIAPGTLMPTSAANTVDAALGRIAFSQVISDNTTFTGTGVLATVRFRVLGPGSANVVFTFTLGNTADTNIASAGTDVLTSAAGGAYTLITPPPPPPTVLAPLLYTYSPSGIKATGTSFPVNIMLDTQGNAIDGADIIMTYNRSVVKVIDANGGVAGVQIMPGTLMSSTRANTVNASYGSIEFSQTTSINTSFSGSGVLATINVQALAPGMANFTFTFVKGRTTDTNVSFGGKDLLAEVANATLQIIENNMPPAVSSFEPSGVIALPRTLIVKAVTNEAGTCRYSLTPGVDYALMNKYFGSADGIEHTLLLYSGFQAGQNNFYVRCRDRAGNTMAYDAIISFTLVADGAAPMITQPSPAGVLFMPKNITISVVPQDQSGTASCKFSLTPNTEYALKPRTLYASGGIFSSFLYSNDFHVGQNNFYVRCKDTLGNTNTSDAVISFTLVDAPKFAVSVEGDSNAAMHMFSISLFSPNSVTEIANIKTQPDRTGTIVLSSDPARGNILMVPGNYDIRIASERYIAKKLIGTNIAGGTVLSVPPLLAGDLNNDGVVNSLDWSIMDTQWSRMFSSADINKDGRVNTLDWGYIRKNWLQTGN